LSDAFKPILRLLASGAPLSAAQTETAFDLMMQGVATPTQVGGLLMAMRVRGETVEEITGAVRAMRAHMVAVQAPADVIDTCGTGGDAAGTVNISTAVAFVVAGCGVRVAKHGNRAVSSKSGAADVLEALGVNIDVPVDTLSRTIGEADLGFLFAPRHHAAMRHVGLSRTELGTRTIFNLLGPCRTRREHGGSCWACSGRNGWRRSSRCCAPWAPRAPGSCTAATGWMN